MKIVALTTCHNRKSLTLRALKGLYCQVRPRECSLEVCLVDDGSTDGTGDAVRACFPSTVVLDGPGNLFWAGGMRFGWNHYVKHRNYDYLLVFNDDIDLYPNALQNWIDSAIQVQALGHKACAVCGTFFDRKSENTAYGGVIRSHAWHPLRFQQLRPTDSIQDCETLNMNIALLSREALDATGFLSPYFRHRRADYDIGLRLNKTGGRVVIAPKYAGECERNSIARSYEDPDAPVRNRWSQLMGPKGEPPQRTGIVLSSTWWSLLASFMDSSIHTVDTLSSK